MLFKSFTVLSVAALAVAAPLGQERRSIDFSKRGNLVDADVNALVGKHTSAEVAATVSKAGDITADIDAKVGKHLLDLGIDANIGLGRLLRGLLGGLFHKRDEIVSIEELAKRSGDILNTDIDASIGHKTKASVDAVLTKSGELTADVDAKVGRLLGLNLDANVGLGRLLRGLFGYHHKRDDITLLSDIELSHLLSTNVDLRVGLSQLLHSLLNVNVDADISKRSTIESTTAAVLNEHGLAAGSLSTVGDDVSVAAGAIANSQAVNAGLEGEVGQIKTDTEALINKSGVALGSYVKDDKSVLGVGSIINKEGSETALIGNLGQLLGVQVSAETRPILKGLLRGLLGKN
ncbi:hypothetical protein JCM5353_006960 [Sporobolomyces roseus]